MTSCDGLLPMLLVAIKKLTEQQSELVKTIHDDRIENEQVRWAICAVVHVLYSDYLRTHPDSAGHGGKGRQIRIEKTEFNRTYFEDVGQDLSSVHSILKKLAERYEWSVPKVTPSTGSTPLGGSTLKF